jgi:hypothetical protein
MAARDPATLIQWLIYKALIHDIQIVNIDRWAGEVTKAMQPKAEGEGDK